MLIVRWSWVCPPSFNSSFCSSLIFTRGVFVYTSRALTVMTGIKAYRETTRGQTSLCWFEISAHLSILTEISHYLRGLPPPPMMSWCQIMSKAYPRVLIGVFDFCSVWFYFEKWMRKHCTVELVIRFFTFLYWTQNRKPTNESLSAHRDKTRVFCVLHFWFYFEKTNERIIQQRNFSALDWISTLATENHLFVCRRCNNWPWSCWCLRLSWWLQLSTVLQQVS